MAAVTTLREEKGRDGRLSGDGIGICEAKGTAIWTEQDTSGRMRQKQGGLASLPFQATTLTGRESGESQPGKPYRAVRASLTNSNLRPELLIYAQLLRTLLHLNDTTVMSPISISESPARCSFEPLQTAN